MDTPLFQRRIEDFVCEHCGEHVTGSGYTNHCSKCLWSKHVDVHPGDRAALCQGLMEPVRVEGSSPEYVLVHQCIKCGQRARIKAQADDIPAVVTLAERLGKSSIA